MSIQLNDALHSMRSREPGKIGHLLWCCTSMERVTPAGRRLVHRMGYVAGWPDWVFLAPAVRVGEAGRVLYMELKAGPTSALSDEQRAVHAALGAVGFTVVVRRSLESALACAVQFARGAEEFDYDA